MEYGFHTGIGMNTGFGDIQAMVSILFVIVIGMFLFIAVKGLGEWGKNNHSPRLTVSAVIVAKRTDVHRSGGTHHRTSTTYYITFQLENGERMEFRTAGSEYGLLVEGDTGLLTFQGTRYLGFER